MFEKGAAFGAASFCIQNYFQRVVAYVCESFYNKEHPQGIYPKGSAIKEIYH